MRSGIISPFWIAAVASTSNPNLLTLSGTSNASAKIGSFSASNYWTADTEYDFSAGRTIVCLFWADTVTDNNQQIWSNEGSAGTSGWYLKCMTGSGSVGGNYGLFRLRFVPGGELVLGAHRYKKGLNCIAIKHTSGGDIVVSVNGNTATTEDTGVSYTTAVTPNHYIGRGRSGNYAASHQMIEAAIIDAELSDADLATASGVVNETNSYHLNSTVRGHGSLLFSVHADDDWDGVASTMVSGLGSDTVTFTKTGTPVQTAIEAEDIYTFPETAIGDSNAATDETTHYGHDAWATVLLDTDATRVRVGVRLTDSTWTHWYDVGADEGATWKASNYVSREGVGDQVIELDGLTSGEKTVRLYTGIQRSSSQFGSYFTGTVRVPTGSTAAVNAPTAKANRCIIVGDSISVGQDCYPLSQHAWSMQMRRSLGSTWSVVNMGYGSRRLVDDGTGSTAMDTFAADIAGRMDGTSRNVLVWETATVDWGADDPVSTWETDLALMLDELKVLVPAVEVFLVHPTERSGEATPNANGDVLEDFRTAMDTIQSTRSSWITILDADAGVTYPTNFDSDNLHLANAGGDEYETLVYNALTA